MYQLCDNEDSCICGVAGKINAEQVRMRTGKTGRNAQNEHWFRILEISWCVIFECLVYKRGYTAPKELKGENWCP